jgi:hypothetical protein
LTVSTERGIHRGTHVPGFGLLDSCNWSDGFGWRYERNGVIILLSDYCIRHLRVYEFVRTRLHIDFLGVLGPFFHRIYVLVVLQNVGVAFDAKSRKGERYGWLLTAYRSPFIIYALLFSLN